MAKTKKAAVKTTAKKTTPVAKATEENNSKEWDMLEQSLNEYQKKFKENGFVLNSHVNPCLERYQAGERTEALKTEIEKLAIL
jgi:hypothetical protein